MLHARLWDEKLKSYGARLFFDVVKRQNGAGAPRFCERMARRMKIVILDGAGLNPGDLSWAEIKSLGQTEIYDKTAPGQLLERAADAEVLITNKTPLTAGDLAALPELRYIGLCSTGYNIVDTGAAAGRGIPVTNVPSYCTLAVAQMTFALLLELTNRVGLHDRAVHQGEWAKSPNFCFWLAPLTELEGKTMGVLGFGGIGQRVARIADSMGMRVVVNTRRRIGMPPYCEAVDFETLLRRSDVLSVNVPLTPQTEKIIGARALALMKRDAILINTSRGQVLDEDAVALALREGRLGGCGVDVLSAEPPKADNPLLTAPNCVITPHIAWAARQSRERLMRTVAENLRCFLNGSPQNVVNGL